jgi:hypothetical protein
MARRQLLLGIGLPCSVSRAGRAAVSVLALASLTSQAHGQLWVRQFGTNADDLLYAATPDGSGGVYTAGSTERSSGDVTLGSADAWLMRSDGAGNPIWSRELHTLRIDSALAAAPDRSGGVFVGGSTYGSLGGTSAGLADAWLARYDSNGNPYWTRQLGTASDDHLQAAASDGVGGLFAVGSTNGSLGGAHQGWEDAWLARFDSLGNQLWSAQLGTLGIDWAQAAAPDGNGGVFVGGTTARGLGGQSAGSSDAWVARYDAAGAQIWIRQIGTSAMDVVTSAIEDGAGGVFLAGRTLGGFGRPNAGGNDAWLARFDGTGSVLWIRQLGSIADDRLNAAASDGSGGVFLCGFSQWALGGPALGLGDAWLARFDSSGVPLGIQQFGTEAYDDAWAACGDGTGGVFLAGETSGSFGAPKAGGTDAWLARFNAP